MNEPKIGYNIFYVGLGKTGSASIQKGFPNEVVPHIHNDNYLYKLTGIDIKKFGYLNLYHFLILNYTTDKKPLFIESLREPVARRISEVFQQNPLEDYDFYINKLINDNFEFNPYILRIKELYDVEINQFFETTEAKFSVIRFEDINSRREYFRNIGYEYVDNHQNNKQNNKIYKDVLNNFKLTESRLLEIYDNDFFKKFYNQNEINRLIEKWKI